MQPKPVIVPTVKALLIFTYRVPEELVLNWNVGMVPDAVPDAGDLRAGVLALAAEHVHALKPR